MGLNILTETNWGLNVIKINRYLADAVSRAGQHAVEVHTVDTFKKPDCNGLQIFFNRRELEWY